MGSDAGGGRSEVKRRSLRTWLLVTFQQIYYGGLNTQISSRVGVAIIAVCLIHTLFSWQARSMYDSSNIEYTWVHKSGVVIPYTGHSLGNSARQGVNLTYMHMGMLERLPNGSLAMAFQTSENYYEGSAEQHLYWSLSDDEGQSWKAPQVLVEAEGVPLWSPVLHQEAGRLFLFFARSSRKCRYFDRFRNVVRHSPGGDIVYITSDNSGGTWTLPQQVLGYDAEDGVPKVVANKVAVLSNGAWVLPFWREPGKTCPVVRSKVERSQQVNGSAGVLITGDQGLTWSSYGSLAVEGMDTWLIENTLVELSTGPLLQLFRSKVGVIYQSTSRDMGMTWAEPEPTMLPNPDSKFHLMMLSNGNLVCAYNASPIKRTPLTVALSRDQGQTWKVVAHVEGDPDLQFAYPTMLEVGGDLWVVYSVMQLHPGLARLVSLGMKVAVLRNFAGR
mmetsp:Transcript_21707/g.68164  ORF Transcript_21707/g.68164 Transcript_21707/m.68164 type:complete len:444 (+) Transcript_21707:2-1333(+)